MDKNSVDPDQLASSVASCSGSTLSPRRGYRIMKKGMYTLHLLGQIQLYIM